MRLLSTSLVLAPWLLGLGVAFCSAPSIAADDAGRLGGGSPPRPSSTPLIATPEEIERMRKSNTEIAAGFARIDVLLNEIAAARTKIKQVIAQHQELALCLALQVAQNEANKLGAVKSTLSPDQKLTLQRYQRTHADFSSDIRKAGIVCPPSQTP